MNRTIEDLRPGDYVVHEHRGVARCEAVIERDGRVFYKLRFADGALYLRTGAAWSVRVIDGPAPLSPIGGAPRDVIRGRRRRPSVGWLHGGAA